MPHSTMLSAVLFAIVCIATVASIPTVSFTYTAAPCTFSISVNNEVWLPARLDGQGHARFLLVDDALDGTESTVFSNFHKFQVSVDQTVSVPH